MERNCYFLLNYNENSSLFLISWILYAQLNDSKLLSGDVKQLQIQCYAPLLIFPMDVRVSSLELIPYNRLEMKNLSHRAQGFILPLLITVSISIGNCCKRLRVGFFLCFLFLFFKHFTLHTVCFSTLWKILWCSSFDIQGWPCAIVSDALHTSWKK